MTPQQCAIVAAARGWIGTPYRHQSSVRGQGADCLGLIRGIWREVKGQEPEAMPIYTSDWSEISQHERMWEGALRHMRLVEKPAAGDMLLFRMRRGAVAKHVAILAGESAAGQTIIHAYTGAGVVETPLTPPWARRVVANFRFPEGDK
ncbi:MAG: NlpC/P60 family protein [Pseudomonadota bacterium]